MSQRGATPRRWLAKDPQAIGKKITKGQRDRRGDLRGPQARSEREEACEQRAIRGKLRGDDNDEAHAGDGDTAGRYENVPIRQCESGQRAGEEANRTGWHTGHSGSQQPVHHCIVHGDREESGRHVQQERADPVQYAVIGRTAQKLGYRHRANGNGVGELPLLGTLGHRSE
jgi:hypothetical protein